jgi:restriction system protein
VWVANQRQRQRQQEAQHRFWLAQQREQEKLRRQAQRDAARGEKAAVAAYQQVRSAEAQEQTAEIERRLVELQGVLATLVQEPAFTAESLRDRAPIPEFSPGRAGLPIGPPDPARYRVAPLSGWQALAPGARRQHDEQVAQAQLRYDNDCRAAEAAEHQRLRWLAEHRQRYQAWVDRRVRDRADRDAEIDDLMRRLAHGQDAAVREYFTAALYASPWPDGFPRRARLAWDASARQLVVDWQLPPVDVVPATARFRYFKTDDRISEITRPLGERRSLYRELIARCVLRVTAELYRSDTYHVLESVALNGTTECLDPATGTPTVRYLSTVMATRAAIGTVDLTRVAPVDCLERHLRGRLSARPDQVVPVRPARVPEQVGNQVVDQGAEDDPDLYRMDPIEFEDLIAALFQARGFAVLTTDRTGDGGVDVIAEDPDPLRGGQIVVQVKRYRNTVPPSAVRDLFGVVTHRGATKGILVTTSGFGPGSHEFAHNKPLTLINGPELVDLLNRHGLPGRLGT